MNSEDWASAEGAFFNVSTLAPTQWHRDEHGNAVTADILCQAPFGGPIAMLSQDLDGIGTLRIVNSMGAFIAERDWIDEEEETMVVIRDCVRKKRSEKDDNASSWTIRNLSMPPGSGRVAAAHIWEGGCVVVTESLRVLEWASVEDSTSKRRSRRSSPKREVATRALLSQSLLVSSLPPRAVTVLRPAVSSSEPLQATILIALPEQPGVIVVESGGNVRAQYTSTNIARSLLLAPHPTYRLVAAIGEDGVLSILPQDFCQVIARHDCRRESRTPDAIMWCGHTTFAVCVWYDTEVIIVPLEHKFPQLSRAHLSGSAPTDENALAEQEQEVIEMKIPFGLRVLEVDGIRIVGKHEVYMLRQVPESWRSVFRLGATDPGAMLLDAVDMLDSGDADGDESLQAIVDGGSILAAIETCLDAAEHATCSDPVQIQLVKVASYGKRFYPTSLAGGKYPTFRECRKLSRRMLATCRLLRLCKASCMEGGVAITTRQLRVLGTSALLDRLLLQGHFALASALCVDANVPMAHVVTHWASGIAQHGTKATPSSELSDEDLRLLIMRKIESLRSQKYVIPVAQIAAACLSEGRQETAVALANHERCLARRVLLLLGAGSEEKAVSAVLNEHGGDPDLSSFVASRALSQAPWEGVVNIAKSSKAACKMLLTHLRATDFTGYKRLLLELDQKVEKAYVLAEESCMCYNNPEKIQLMKEASLEFRDAGAKNLSHLASEHARLLDRQNQLGDSVVGLSLANTVLDCIRRGLDEEADAFARDFGLKESVYRRIQLRGLAARKAWTRIQDLACQASVTTAVSLADFAEICANSGNLEEASRYLYQLPDSHERKAHLLILIRKYDEAIEAAFSLGDKGALEIIRRHRPELASAVQEKLAAIDETQSKQVGKAGLESSPFASLDDAKKAAQGCAQQ